MNGCVLARNGDIALGDPMEKTLEEQVEIERMLLEILAEDGYELEMDEDEER